MYLVGSLRIFEVLKEARVFWGVVPCSLVNMHQHFSAISFSLGECILRHQVYPSIYVVASQKTAILIRLVKIQSAQWLVAVGTVEEMLTTTLHTHTHTAPSPISRIHVSWGKKPEREAHYSLNPAVRLKILWAISTLAYMYSRRDDTQLFLRFHGPLVLFDSATDVF
jgi:hypothetical protein